MPYQPFGEYGGEFNNPSSVDFRNIRGGTVTSKEIILAGGTQGVIRSQNFDPSNDEGWRILGDGSAVFNDVAVRGTIIAGAGSDVGFDAVSAGTNTAALVIGSGGDMRSSNFSAGAAGWQIKGNGDAEFNNVEVRGAIHAESGTITGALAAGNGVYIGTPVDAGLDDGWSGIALEHDGSTTVTALMRLGNRTLFRVNHGGTTSLSFDTNGNPPLSIKGPVTLDGRLQAGNGVEIGTPVDSGNTDWSGINLSPSNNNVFMRDPSGRVLFRVNHGGTESISFDSASSPALTITGTIESSVFQTASSGERLEIRGDDDEAFIRFFESGGSEVASMGFNVPGFNPQHAVFETPNLSGHGITIFAAGTGGVNISASSSVVAIQGNNHVLTSGFRAHTSNNPSAPAYGFRLDSDTGMYRSGTGEVAFASNGSLVFRSSNDSDYALLLNRGRLSWIGDTDTFISVGSPDTGADQMSLTVGGVQPILLGTTGVRINHDHSIGDTSGLFIGESFADIGNHETLRADRGGTSSTEVGYFSSWASGKADIISLATSPRFPGTGIIDKINPVDFQRKSTEQREWGFLLDEFQELDDNLRYLTTKGDQWGYSPDEFALIAVLWEGLKEARQKIRSLEDRMEAVEAALQN